MMRGTLLGGKAFQKGAEDNEKQAKGAEDGLREAAKEHGKEFDNFMEPTSCFIRARPDGGDVAVVES